MKKLLASLLAAMLVFAMGTVAFADEKTVGSEQELIDAIETAVDGDIIKLSKDIEVTNLAEAENNNGAFTIDSGKNIVIDGNGYSIKAVGENWNGASMFNVQGEANVTFQNLTIDSNNLAKHGININGASVEVKDVEIVNGNGYAIVCNYSVLKVDGLKTSGNAWGGINGDARIADKTYSITITDANISEENSVCFENKEKVSGNEVSISGGSFVNVGNHPTDYPEDAPAPEVSVTGGTYGNDISDYTADDAVIVKSGENYSVGGDAYSAVAAAKAGETITVIKAPANTEFSNVGSNVTIVNNSGETIVVNNKEVKDSGSIKIPTNDSTTDSKPSGENTTTIVVGDKDDDKTDSEKNPGTGAPMFVSIAAAAAVVALGGIVLSKKR